VGRSRSGATAHPRRGARGARGLPPGRVRAARRPLAADAILCSITGFGADGPRAQQAGHDLNYVGYAGVLADTAPALPPIQIADLAAGGQTAVIEILAALLEGGPKRIVVSMTHASHRFVAHRLAATRRRGC
jgi:Predicted acyl-CoA transferases/carnitine dehydratase